MFGKPLNLCLFPEAKLCSLHPCFYEIPKFLSPTFLPTDPRILMCPKSHLDAPLKHHPRQHQTSLGAHLQNRVLLVPVQRRQGVWLGLLGLLCFTNGLRL